MAKTSKEALVLQSKPVTAAVLTALNGGGERLAATFRSRLFALFASNPESVVRVALSAKDQGIPVKVNGIRNNDYARLEEARALFNAWRLPRARVEVEAFNGGWGKLVAFARSVQSAVKHDDDTAKAERDALATVLAASGKTLETLLTASDAERASVAATVQSTIEAAAIAKQDKVAAAKAAREQPAKVAAAWIKAHNENGFAWMQDVAREIAKQVKVAKDAAEAQANAAKQAGDDAAAGAVKDAYTKAQAIKAAA